MPREASKKESHWYSKSILSSLHVHPRNRERERGREKDWGIFPLTSKDHHPHKAFSIKRGAATTPLPSARAHRSQARELGARTSLDIRALLCVCVALRQTCLPPFLPSVSFSNCKCLFFTFFSQVGSDISTVRLPPPSPLPPFI